MLGMTMMISFTIVSGDDLGIDYGDDLGDDYDDELEHKEGIARYLSCIIMKEGPLGLVMLMLGLMWNPSYEALHNEEEAANMANVDHPEIFKQSTHISVGLGCRKRYSRYLNILKTFFRFSTEL